GKPDLRGLAACFREPLGRLSRWASKTRPTLLHHSEYSMMRIRILWLAAAAGLAVLCPASLHAQKGFGGKNDPGLAFTRSNPTFLKAFREVVAGPSRSTVRVLTDDKDTALGVVVDQG